MNIKDKQVELMKLFRAFDAVCRSENINYSLACGTALGAVREKGFIAWDGDLDILMSLPEYERICSIVKKYPSKFTFASYETDKNTPLFYARIYPVDMLSKCLEDYPYIDINVYSGAPEDLREANRALKICNLSFKVFWVKNRNYIHDLKRRKNLIGLLLQTFLRLVPSKLCLKCFLHYRNAWSYENAGRVMALQGFYGAKEILPKNWLDHYTDIEFNGYKAQIITQWDSYLSQLYGDYMMPVQYKRYTSN